MSNVLFPITRVFYLVLFFLSICVNAQDSYKKGRYVNQKGEIMEGYIYHLDWMNNPEEIKFKLDTVAAVPEVVTIDELKEFEIIGVCKYIKFEGLIDQSLRNLSDLDTKRNPDWKQSKVLLKVLLESDASLYYYSNDRIQRFFYSVGSKNISLQQLVYKEFYKDGDRTTPVSNYEFRQQLITNLSCDGSKTINFRSLKYSKNDLLNCFTVYNVCTKSKQIDYNSSSKAKSKFNYYALLAVSSVAFETKGGKNYVGNELQRNKFDTTIYYRFGGELEMILPINNNKWALYIHPMYEFFKAENTKEGIYGQLNYKVDYEALLLPLGVRHYLFINPNSKLFINGAVAYNINLGSSLVVGNDSSFNFWKTVFSLNAGIGYVFKDKFCFELRYNNATDLVNSMSFKSSVNDIGLMFKYKLN